MSASGRLRILHCVTANNGMTGVETFLLQLCAAQVRAGDAPSIVLEVPGRDVLGDRREVVEAGEAMGVPVHDLPARTKAEGRLPGKIGTALLLARRIRFMWRLLRQADVLHVHAVGMGGIDPMIAATLSPGRPVVFTQHTTFEFSLPSWRRLDDITLWMLRRVPRRVVVPFSAATEGFIAAGIARERSATIPLCFDETRFSSDAEPPRAGRFRVLVSARLHEGKGHEDLLTAIADLAPRHPGLRLVVAGDGPTRERIQAETARLGIESVVEFLGRVGHAEMPSLYRSAQLIVLPSYMPGETFPVCLLEGMAVGLPAVGTRWTGIPDIIEDGKTGIIVEPRDTHSLAAAIERFLVDPAFHAAASRAARERAHGRFTAGSVSSAYRDAYRAAGAG
jgi:glycosyltransferase involved in cell wall biosynthesis